MCYWWCPAGSLPSFVSLHLSPFMCRLNCLGPAQCILLFFVSGLLFFLLNYYIYFLLSWFSCLSCFQAFWFCCLCCEFLKIELIQLVANTWRLRVSCPRHCVLGCSELPRLLVLSQPTRPGRRPGYLFWFVCVIESSGAKMFHEFFLCNSSGFNCCSWEKTTLGDDPSPHQGAASRSCSLSQSALVTGSGALNVLVS